MIERDIVLYHSHNDKFLKTTDNGIIPVAIWVDKFDDAAILCIHSFDNNIPFTEESVALTECKNHDLESIWVVPCTLEYKEENKRFFPVHEPIFEESQTLKEFLHG